MVRARITTESSKQCVICGQTFERREDENWNKFAVKKVCSPECKSELLKRTRAQKYAEAWACAPVKKCEACGKELEHRKGESLSKYLNRKVCSSTCSGKLATARYLAASPDKTCPVCGKVFTQECAASSTVFANMVFCSLDCYATALSNGDNVGTHKNLVRSCEVCGRLFTIRDNEYTQAFRTRKTCSRKCSAVMRKKHETAFQEHKFEYNPTLDPMFNPF